MRCMYVRATATRASNNDTTTTTTTTTTITATTTRHTPNRYIAELYDHMDYVNGIYGAGTIKMIRLGKRSGLMVARVEGAKVATGKVLTYLDSHVSAQQGWLQVLMKRVSEDPRHVVMPIIDGLSQTFECVLRLAVVLLVWRWC
jgi:hypothetical protein